MTAVVPYSFTPPVEEPVRTRCGYTPAEVIQSLTKLLGEAGALSSGRVLHFTADLVCSGGYNSFSRTIWEYALTHVGIASPRIFVYLKQRTNDILEMLKTLPDETAYLTMNPANERHLLESIAQEPSIRFTPEEFREMVKKL